MSRKKIWSEKFRQKKTYVGVSLLMKFQAGSQQLCLATDVFPWFLQKFAGHFFYWTPQGD